LRTPRPFSPTTATPMTGGFKEASKRTGIGLLRGGLRALRTQNGSSPTFKYYNFTLYFWLARRGTLPRSSLPRTPPHRPPRNYSSTGSRDG
jgi:hypothetical protein